ncbi:Regulatory Protein [Streptomyces leeuwenhoekii]|uniref:Regulatory Protein n=2 Tax=Streptomyces leeuwenhoekii TaxID=1437453 RepID=A0A0F7VVI1_STRLW|nr:Regulatory Protein [Streptomyces leeuwenhoekii]
MNVFEQEGNRHRHAGGGMKRQAGGGGPTTVGAPSAHGTTRQQTGSTGAAAPQLRRRLGRADLRAVPEARRALRDLLRQWGRPGRSAVAELLTSELVTNALIHTDDDAVLTATVGPRGVRVEVRDFVAGRLRPSAPAPGDATNGRGLVLLESLADAWGVRAHGVGKSVWFELDAEAG